MKLYYDRDADISILEDKRIAVIGYGNQGRAQALNLRDSGLDVLVGNRDDEYAGHAAEDGFSVLSIEQASAEADIVMLLVPDEVASGVFEKEIVPGLSEADVLVFASGYNVAFGLVELPATVDVVLVAPRMIGAGVRDLYVAGQGFPSFFGVHQDHSGQAKAIALALTKAIGSTRMGAVEVTFAQEADLDLFTEQCFGPAFGHVLTTAVNLLLDEGYPPEAVLLELYMSGEFAYTLTKIAELGLIEQSVLHSRTSQYGSMSRGMRFMLPETRAKMAEGLEEIRSGKFAQEWAEEQAAGAPTLDMLKDAARMLPLYQAERELRQALRVGPDADPEGPQAYPEVPDVHQPRSVEGSRVGGEPWSASAGASHDVVPPGQGGLYRRGLDRLRRLRTRVSGQPTAALQAGGLTTDQLQAVLRRFLAGAAEDPALRTFSQGRAMTSHYVLSDAGLEFYMRFEGGTVETGQGSPAGEAEVRLETTADVLDGMFTGRVNAMRAAMTGKLTFGGEVRLAMSIQQIQDDLKRLYSEARAAVEAG
jgi:ketol-acid reductoisomerase